MYRKFESQYLEPLPSAYEPAVYEEEDIIWPGSDDEDGRTGEERAIKRRRIEEHGLDYLHGGAPFILTASLKGPFDNGWVNPWGKNQESDGATVRPLTQEELKQSSEEPASPSSPPPNPQPVAHGYKGPFEDDSSHEDGPHLVEHQQKVGDEHVLRIPSPGQPFRSSPIRNSEWLKKDDGRRNIKNRHHSHSPTPRFREQSATSVANRFLHGQLARESEVDAEKASKVTKSNRQVEQNPGDEGKAKKSPRARKGPIRQEKHDQVKTVSMSRHNVLHQRSPKPILVDQDEPNGVAQVKREQVDITPRKRYLHRERTFVKNSPPPMLQVEDSMQADAAQSPVEGAKAEEEPGTMVPHEVPTDYVSGPSGSSSESSSHEVSAREEEANKSDGHAPQSDDNTQTRRKAAISKFSRRLTFTPNGASQIHDSRPVSRSLDDKTTDVHNRENHPDPQPAVIPTRSSSASRMPLSKESSNFQEAQIKELPPPLQTALTRSSTNLLETEKQLPTPVFGDEDSYMVLSTQAGLEKARKRFQDDVLAEYANQPASPEEQRHRTDHHTPYQEDIPISTQAMMNELSPFDISTIKKRSAQKSEMNGESRRRTTHQRSPSDPVPAPPHQYSPNMSTSIERSQSQSQTKQQPPLKEHHTPSERSAPSLYMSAASSSRSKIVSHGHPPRPTEDDELTSFSIQPDGTLTETRIDQDGQQYDPYPLPEESTSLPSFSVSSKPPTSSAYNKVSFSVNNRSHNPSPDRVLSKHEGDDGHQSESQAPSPPPEAHNSPNHYASQRQEPPSSPGQTPFKYRWDQLTIPAFDAEAEMNTQDKEAEAFIEEAAAIPSDDWDVEKEARRLSRESWKGSVGPQRRRKGILE